MIRDILEFIRREKGYTFLLFILLGCYAYFYFFSPAMEHGGKQSDVLVQFRAIEQKVYQDIQSAESLAEFLRSKPVLNQILGLFSFLAAGAFSVGLVINFFLLFNPSWRRSLTNHAPPAIRTEWKLSMLFQVIILWLVAGLGLNLLIFLVRSFLLPSVSINFFLLLHTTVSDILCIAFIIYILHQNQGHWRDLGLWVPKGKFWQEVIVGLGGYLAILPLFFAVLLFLAYLAHLFAYEPPPHPLLNVFLEEEKRSPILIAYSIFLASVLAPIFEEIFFRGFCYSVLKARWGVRWAMILSSALFAFIHQNSFAFWPIFVLGMGMAYLYEKRKTLVPSIVLHIVHNSVFIGYFFTVKYLLEYAANSGHL